jgi:UDP-N-acetylglucosamine kinase
MSVTQVGEEAKQYIKEHKKELCEKFASKEIYLPTDKPSSYFMAGSPGAGKTEYSKSFIEQLQIKSPERKIVRIDADEVRDFIPSYNKTNADLVQGAAAIGVEKLLDCVLKNNQDFLLDATFADYLKSYQNITRCLQHKRKVGITYIYQDPLVAWDFTKKREKVEGRPVPKQTFIKALFSAKENVDKIKREFKEEIQLDLVIKNVDQKTRTTHFNIDQVANYLNIEYNPQTLEGLLI